MVTVKIIRQSSGKAESGVKVALGFDGFSRGVTSDQWTDSNGEASFDADSGNGKVFVNGRTEHEGYLSGRVTVYI